MSRVTIKDIARALGVNPSTVSRALHDHPDVSAELKANIKHLAEQMGYRPNQIAINLRHGKSRTIGLIIPEISMFFFPSVMKAIEEQAHARGYNLLMLHSNDDIQREIQNASICAFAGVEGVLVSLTKQSYDLSHFQELTYNDIPVVYFDKVPPHIDGHKVIIPGRKATQEAMRYLLQSAPQAHRICGFFGDPRLSITQDRLEGFRESLESAGLKFNIQDVFFATSSTQAETVFTELWHSQQRPQAIYMMSDEILSGVMKAVNHLGIQIPQDIHLVAISDGFLPYLIPQKVPYVETSGYNVGFTAANHLFDIISGKKSGIESIFIDTPFKNS